MTHPVHDLPDVLRPAVEKYRDEAEALGRLPEELVRELREHGAFRLYTPRELGGHEATPAVVLELLTRLARLDGPTAWTVWNLNLGFVAGLLGPERAEEVFGGGRDPLIANSGQPGRMSPAEGGFRLTGTWKIVSGAHLADWFLLAGMLPAGPGTSGWGAGLFFCLVPRDAVTVLDTWDVAGMRASDSNSVTADEVFVPSDLAFSLFAPNRLDRPAYRLPTVNVVFPGCAAVLIGMAQAAVDELVRLAGGKTAFTGEPLAAMESTQVAVGRAAAQVAAARGLLLSTAGELDRTTAAGRETTEEQRAAVRGAIAHVTETARTVLVSMYATASSGSALHDQPAGPHLPRRNGRRAGREPLHGAVVAAGPDPARPAGGGALRLTARALTPVAMFPCRDHG
ncbi:acyl-CoA dehydrogenase family protein [Actinoplanes sp. RD1]|uniref:acyl-CoA dehydrogenase family protein n=1 Tax=Actinoplanes sp. RD1 TaxID=3064538 RepID=UPI00274059EE|nr:acyl-CoA dehydrogenase family protein [Actinoplanes sp. RD1]